MSAVKYQGDIAKFLLEMENLNIHTKMTGVAWRKMIEDQLPEQALFRMSMHDHDDEAKWVAEIRRVTRMDEDFKEWKSLRGGGFSNPPRSEKRKAEDTRSSVSAKKAKVQYTAKEKAEYKKKKAAERKVKK